MASLCFVPRISTILLSLIGMMMSGIGAVTAADLGLLPEAVDEDVLGEMRARENTLNVGQLGRVTEHAVLHDNSVVGGHSGANVIGAGALDNARGIATVIQNSGHNVIIQESLVVNITVAP